MTGRKIGGRPKKEIPLDKIIRARFTTTEFNDINKKSEVLKITKSELIRILALKGKVVNLFTDDEEKAIRGLISLANNLNQLVKLAHTFGLETMTVKAKNQMNQIDEILEKYQLAKIKRK